MKIERKKAREELDSINAIEWRTPDNRKRFFLLVRRPERGQYPIHPRALFHIRDVKADRYHSFVFPTLRAPRRTIRVPNSTQYLGCICDSSQSSRDSERPSQGLARRPSFVSVFKLDTTGSLQAGEWR